MPGFVKVLGQFPSEVTKHGTDTDDEDVVGEGEEEAAKGLMAVDLRVLLQQDRLPRGRCRREDSLRQYQNYHLYKTCTVKFVDPTN